jgi:6-phosphofructokinase 1
LGAGIAGGADVILIPEIPFDLDRICERLREDELHGKRWGIVVAAEGARPVGGEMITKPNAEVGRQEVLLGGVAEWAARQIAERSGRETRSLVLGHLQRGGSPTTFDRAVALRFGAAAVRFIAEKKRNVMVAYQPPEMVAVPLADVITKNKQVPVDSDTVMTCRELGISFGD